MTRDDVYKACLARKHVRDGICELGETIPKALIDLIIDCAVEEAVERIKRNERRDLDS